MDLGSLAYGGVYLLGFLLYVLLPSSVFSLGHRLLFALFAANGAIIGGRLGYVFFYEPLYYLGNPIEAVELWKGGMSFHGGVIGLAAGCYLCAYLSGNGLKAFMHAVDRACIIALVIIPLGRCCNFINGELWGRVTSVPWGVVFEGADDNPRHPVQLYEAFFEGPLLALLLLILYQRNYLTKPLMISCWYLLGYSFFRFFTEFFREADAMVGYFYGFTLGQFLCLFCMLAGIVCLRKIWKT
jgi:phosphatidylglycerol:prolipoprotein diacylglycerol transferase